MSIVRSPRPEANYYVLAKSISEDKRLSWAARGILIFLLGKPDHWTIVVTSLINETQDSGKPSGRDAVYGLLRELIDTGYIRKVQAQTQNGVFEPVDYIVSEIPLTENPEAAPLTALPLTAQPHPANPTLVSTEISNELIPSNKGNSLSTRTKARRKCKTALPEDFNISTRVQTWAKEKGFDRLEEHLEAFKAKCAAKGYTYADHDAAFMEAIREDWAKLRLSKGTPARKPATENFAARDYGKGGRL